jgi:hypothetical protein
MKLRFNLTYFALFILLFVIEILIAIYIKDKIIRPFVGDILVHILIYCMLLSFFDLPKLKTAFYVLIFAFLVEFLQYFKIVSLLGLEKNSLAKIIIGTSFSWMDLLCYTIGFFCVLPLEYFFESKKIKK